VCVCITAYIQLHLSCLIWKSVPPPLFFTQKFYRPGNHLFTSQPNRALSIFSLFFFLSRTCTAKLFIEEKTQVFTTCASFKDVLKRSPWWHTKRGKKNDNERTNAIKTNRLVAHLSFRLVWMKHVESLAKTRRYPVEIATHEDGVLVAAHMHICTCQIVCSRLSRGLTLAHARWRT
jgi:hypothetical protein